MRLPMTVTEVTPAWLESALRRNHPTVRVEDVEIIEQIQGTSSKIRINASYADPPTPATPPAALCIKGGFDDDLRSFNTTGLYRLEADFFRHLAPGLAVRKPRAWFAESSTDQGIVIMDDLVATGCTFWSPVEAWSVDQVAAALESLASMHAATWGMGGEQHPWLTHGSPAVQGMIPALFGDANWQDMLARPDVRHVPDEQRDRPRMLRGFEAVWRHDLQGVPCVVHWDPHIGNTYLDAQGRPGFADWQCVCRTSCFHDVGYFVGGALTFEDRRRTERDLLGHYLDALAAHGVSGPGWDEAWLDYRRYQLYGFLWVLCSPLMQPVDIIAAMTERHAAAIADHDPLHSARDNALTLGPFLGGHPITQRPQGDLYDRQWHCAPGRGPGVAPGHPRRDGPVLSRGGPLRRRADQVGVPPRLHR